MSCGACEISGRWFGVASEGRRRARPPRRADHLTGVPTSPRRPLPSRWAVPPQQDRNKLGWSINTCSALRSPASRRSLDGSRLDYGTAGLTAEANRGVPATATAVSFRPKMRHPSGPKSVPLAYGGPQRAIPSAWFGHDTRLRDARRS